MTPADRARRTAGPPTKLLPGVGAVIVGGLILAKNPLVLVLLLTDGVIAAAVLASATLGGVALLPLFRLGSLPGRWRWLLGAGLGIGLLANLVMLAGWAGFLDRTFWLAVLVLGAMAGAITLWRRRSHDGESAIHNPQSAIGPIAWLWLFVCPFLALTILVASVPPGYLWAEEGNGY
ncbi:MAG: hypothetical protein GY778_06930, partial [bacterium]|nr:hypothetical protein [bacterium]